MFPIIGTGLLVLALLGCSARSASTPRSGVTMVLSRRLRHRPRLQHAAADPRRAERGAAAGHGRRDLVGHVLPADGRHARHGGLPLGAVLHRGWQDRVGVPHRRGDAGLPGRAQGPAGAGRPDQPAGGRARSPAAAACRRARWTTRRSCPSSTTGWPSRSSTGFSSSIDLVFLAAAVVVLVAFVIVFFLPEEKLRTMSGIEARRQDDAAAAAAAAGSRLRRAGRRRLGAVQPDGGRRHPRRGGARRGRPGGARHRVRKVQLTRCPPVRVGSWSSRLPARSLAPVVTTTQ